MKTALIGASGFVGSAILNEALRRGHHITAIERHPALIKIQDPKLTAVKCDIFNTDELAEILRGHDTVISSYNPGWTNPKIFDDTIHGYQSIINAVKKAHLKRILVVGGAGSLEAEPGRPLVDHDDFPKDWKLGAEALRDVLNMFRHERELNWTFFSPAINIFPGERTGKFTLGGDEPVLDNNGQGRISVQDYAVAMIDELEKPKHVNQRFTIGYR
ncbi:MAG TPA: NAD(P)-dependent oxidoreductase [Ignavibacteriales bacterium]|nr:NAD(P)-dependent oxidoreductase [Ignavibacteriales bacterium]